MNALIPVFAMFFGSFLLFGIQPMLGRTLLPPFGGSAAVWTVCLAAYQVLLLVGYGYAHLLAKRSARTQRVTHLALLGLAVAWTFAFAALRLFLKGHIGNSAEPSLEVLFCVTLFVGLPYVLLSANSTLIQAWLAGAGERTEVSGQRSEIRGQRAARVESRASSVGREQTANLANGMQDGGNAEVQDGDRRTPRGGVPTGGSASDGGDGGSAEVQDGDRRTPRGGVPTGGTASDGRDGSPSRPQSTGNQPRSSDSRNVYKLYAVSNLGSLLGLLVYPFLLEPFVSLNAQWYGFAACLLAYAVLLGFVAKMSDVRDQRSEVRGHGSEGGERGAIGELSGEATGERSEIGEREATANHANGVEDGDRRTPRGGVPTGGTASDGGDGSPTSDLRPLTSDLPAPLTRAWLWFALPTVSTFLLNAVTMHLSTDVTPVPMMWVLLLTAYLLSFIIGFSVIGEKGLIVWAGLAVLTLAGAAYISGLQGGRAFLPSLTVGVLLVLVCCTCLHGWLYRIRPDAAHLTRFYLGIAAGGALGGVSASLIAPVLFNRVWEYPLGLIAVCAACAWLIHVCNYPELKGLNRFLLAVAGVAAFLVFNNAIKGSKTTITRMRNFYGCLLVDREDLKTQFGDTLTLFRLRHGETLHGDQVRERFLRDKPTTYYGPKGGGLAVSSHTNSASGTPMRVGVVGLGAGTMACYGRTNDVYRFFEINPQVIQVATDTNYFTYVADSAAKIEFALGDARKRLEQERTRQEPKYDVLVVDAYSGDSIPYHLASQEAFRLYLDRLNTDGILAVHISNWHIDLAPLCKAVANEFSLQATGIIAMPEGLTTGSVWVYLTRMPMRIATDGPREMNWKEVREMSLPTDEKGSLLPLIRFGFMPPLKELEIDLNTIKLY